jgi:hypothetical protein
MNRGSLRMLRDKVDLALQQIEPAYTEVRRLAADGQQDPGDVTLMVNISQARAHLHCAQRQILAALSGAAPATTLPTSEEKEDKHGTA